MSTGELTMLREKLVEQVREHAGGITDPVAGALGAVPRHLFLPDVPFARAYRNDAIVTKRDQDGQPISSSSQPTIMALMLDQLGLAPGQRVLEIGAGTGYNAALISHLVSPGGGVVSLDIDLDLVRQARENLARAGYAQVDVVCVDGADGFAAGAPYDRIIATVGVPDLAPGWLEQLAPGGRLVVPLDLCGVQRSVAFEYEDGRWVSRSVVPCGFMRLRGSFAGPERTYVLSRDSDLSIMAPDGGVLDSGALLTALDGPPVVRSTHVVVRPEKILTDLALWLAITEPRWCVLAESETAARRRLSAAPRTIQHLRITVGLRSGDGVAFLAHEPGSPTGRETLVLGFGAGAGALADQLVAQVSAWDRAGRPGEGLRIDAYSKPRRDGASPGALVIGKKDHEFVLSWPPLGDDSAAG